MENGLAALFAGKNERAGVWSRFVSDDSSQNIDESPESREPGVVVNGKNQDCEPGIQVSKDRSIEMNSFNVSKSNNRGGLSERIAGRAGFGNLTIDTSQIMKTTSFSSPTTDHRSPLLTIPPGLSPTMLLGSPIFVSNSLAITAAGLLSSGIDQTNDKTNPYADDIFWRFVCREQL